MRKRHRIQFPPTNTENLDQDQAFFYLTEGDSKREIRFHDYDEIYKVSGLYEQLFYERLKCRSPKVVSDILESTMQHCDENLSELRVLDLGAGNGIMGEELKRRGICRLVGTDIIQEAADAAERDRPDVYDEYYIADFTNLTDELREEFTSWNLNALTTVAALGFGDIPPQAFINAFNMLQSEGWVAFNIRDSFLDNSDDTGFSKTIRELVLSEYLDLYHVERYRHRYSINGEPLFYFAIAARKNADIPADFVETHHI